jgi:hypothetical protein
MLLLRSSCDATSALFLVGIGFMVQNRMKMRLSHIPLMVVLLVIGCRANADQQNSSSSASPEFNSDTLPTGSFESEMIMVADSAQSAMGVSTASASKIVEGERELMELVLVQEMGRGTMFDSLWVDALTMRPVRYRNVMPGFQSIKVDYGPDGHITGLFTRAQTELRIDTVTTEVLYDGGGFQGMIAALPLSEGFEAEIPVFNYATGRGTVHITVLGTQIIDSRGEKVPTWKVAYRPGGGLVAHLFIDQNSRHIIRSEAEVSPGRTFVTQARPAS